MNPENNFQFDEWWFGVWGDYTILLLYLAKHIACHSFPEISCSNKRTKITFNDNCSQITVPDLRETMVYREIPQETSSISF